MVTLFQVQSLLKFYTWLFGCTYKDSKLLNTTTRLYFIMQLNTNSLIICSNAKNYNSFCNKRKKIQYFLDAILASAGLYGAGLFTLLCITINLLLLLSMLLAEQN